MANLISERDHESCLRFFKATVEQEGTIPDAMVYRLAVTSAMYLQDEMATSLYEEAKKQGKECRGIKEAPYYNQMVRFLGKQGALMAQINILGDMVRNEVPFSEYTFAPIIWNCRQLGKVDPALSVLREAIKYRCATTNIFTNVISLCKEQRPEEVPRLEKEMAEVSGPPNLIGYHVLLKGARSLTEARKLCKEMEEEGLALDQTCYNILLGLCDDREYQEGMSLLRQMNGKGIYPDEITFIQLIKLISRAGSFQDAWEVYEMMKDWIQLSTKGMNCMINCCSHFRSLKQAEQVFSDMEQAQIEPDVITFNCLIKAACNGDSIGRAMDYFRLMPTKGIEPDEVTFNTLIRKSAMVNVTLAHSLYQDMLASGLQPTIYTFVPLATVYSRRRFTVRLEQLGQEMIKYDVAPNPLILGAFRDLRIEFPTKK